MKLLIVDDSKVMRMIVVRTLRQAGFGEVEFEEAGDGPEARERVRASRPDLVLCDWNMPGMSGLELLDSLREEGIDVPFGFITSENEPEFRHSAMEHGASFLIAKPFTPEVFRQVLHDWLEAA